MDNILVLGGTGFVGRHVCEKLIDRSTAGRIVVPTRTPGRGGALRVLPTLELVLADVHDPAALARLVAGADAVINLVAILHGSEAAFERTHVMLPRQVAQACTQAGVRRLIHVSSLGAATDAPSRYLRSKGAGEAVLRAESGLDLTVLRPSVIFGEGDRSLNLFASLQRVLPVMPLACAHARFQPVWVEDVAQAIVRCLDDRRSIGKTYECAGPEVCTLADMVRQAGRWSGHPRPVLSLPQGLARLQALAMECLPGPPLLSRDNLDSMRVPSIASGRLPGLDALGITPVSMGTAAAPALAGHSSRARYGIYRAQARRG